MKRGRLSSSHRSGFTLLELLTASVITMVILVLVMTITNHASNIWIWGNSRVEAFQNARRGFNILTSQLEQATLNTYWDYRDSAGNFRSTTVASGFVPHDYGRKSELHFFVDHAGSGGTPGTKGCGQAVFFQAPGRKANPLHSDYERFVGLLNACGFYVEWNTDEDWLPTHVDKSTARKRFRLMQMLEDTEDLSIGASPSRQWVRPTIGNTFVVAEDVIALVIWPRESGTSTTLNSYGYDSRNDVNSVPQGMMANQLPSQLQVAMVAVDETIVARLGDGHEAAIKKCLDGLFFSDPAEKGQGDLQTLEQRLRQAGIGYRVFQSSIQMREARWGGQQ